METEKIHQHPETADQLLECLNKSDLIEIQILRLKELIQLSSNPPTEITVHYIDNSPFAQQSSATFILVNGQYQRQSKN